MTSDPTVSIPANQSSAKRFRGLNWLIAGLGSLLIAGVFYSHPLGRETAAHGLGLLGPRSIPWLLALLADSDEHVKKVVHDEISNMGPIAIPPLLAELKGSRPSTRAYAAAMLGVKAIHAGQEFIVSTALLPLLEDKDRLARLAAVETITVLGHSAFATLPTLKALLNDSDAETRLFALQAVVAIDRESAETLSALLASLKDPLPKVRQEVCLLLEVIGTQEPQVVTALVDLLNDPIRGIRASAIDYLGEIGAVGRVAIPALQIVADNDPEPELRAMARQSIHSLSDLQVP